MWIFYKDSNGNKAAFNLMNAKRVKWVETCVLRVFFSDTDFIDLDPIQSQKAWRWLEELPTAEGWGRPVKGC